MRKDALATPELARVFDRSWFHRLATDYATNVMLFGQNGQLTYADVARAVGARSRQLLAAGVRGRVPVAVSGLFEFVPTFFAMVDGGIVPALINPAFTPPERESIRLDCGANWFVQSRDGATVLQTLDASGKILRESPLKGEFAGAARASPAPEPAGEEALMFYTSGSTGRMKGAVHTLDSAFGNAAAVAEVVGARADDRYLVAAPLFHSFGAGAGLLAALAKGASIANPEGVGALGILDQVERQKITVLVCGVSLLRQLVLLARKQPGNWSSLRTVLVAGSALPSSVARDAMNTICPGIRNLYGTSETGGIAVSQPTDPVETLGSVGKPIPGVELRIVDERRRALGVSELGEIACKTPGCFREYLNMPEVTRRVRDGDWYYTGDLGQLDRDGRLTITGRKDDVIAKSGFKVYPREVDLVLSRLPEIAETVVVGVADERMGQRVRAVVVPQPGRDVSVRELRAFCAKQLIYYKVPDEFVVVQELPRTASGKVDQSSLRRPDWPVAGPVALPTSRGMKEAYK